ncbi:MAG: DNA mismatch repair protein MutS, partial [Bacteroidales bacterium]|nr:DNA mismatch repair protein MutS [Bacteroidales bacterium]
KYLNNLSLSLNNLAEIDIFLAKADLFIRWNLSIPNISKEKTYYQALFNPEISISLEKQGNKYQPVSLFIERNSPVVLMGANMGGKSVSLRTIALSQYMFQFGFGVPAENAEIVPVHQIFHLSGDYQDLNKGLSSFAAEMKMIDLLLKESERTNSILALLDEPARTTNPYEGKALVESLLSFLRERMLLTIVATHYNVDALDCTKMRVKGYENGRMNYELVYTQDNEAPQEAITIARSLGVNEKWLEEASRLIGKK